MLVISKDNIIKWLRTSDLTIQAYDDFIEELENLDFIEFNDIKAEMKELKGTYPTSKYIAIINKHMRGDKK